MGFLSHGFHHSLQFSMMFSTFCLNVSVELFESVEPRLELGNEMDFLVMHMCASGQGEIHPSFVSSRKESVPWSREFMFHTVVE